MAVTYDKIAYDEIELGLRSVISKEFQNVYIGSEFKMLGSECIKIDLLSSTSIEQATNFETREYALNMRYYFKADTSQELINKAVKGKIDRLRKHLLDNQVDADNNWAALIVNTINYNVQDEENEEETNLHIAEYEITIQHFNHFTQGYIMAKYKAKAGFKDLDNKFFGIHKINNLLKGGSVDITDFDSLPESVKKELQPLETKQKKKPKAKKKGVK